MAIANVIPVRVTSGKHVHSTATGKTSAKIAVWSVDPEIIVSLIATERVRAQTLI